MTLANLIDRLRSWPYFPVPADTSHPYRWVPAFLALIARWARTDRRVREVLINSWNSLPVQVQHGLIAESFKIR